mmetsp:Transcript_13793/g.30650  ORF Transcript_13793/g.30650 Transcript_13793/m.30650 type:complete len:133 (+) Transcript_13793:2094-2492(+)|eukprot:CAMPEP_0178682834 /NCGR_PEP_ID=MMETSP0699-20121125/1984_1 /TAXON_ID=265572 /ORGANISM="Extubocellulus spinifer, Strain CCMP396" /LENGTH=132 /DNA_ID=CAMNT_0020327393 /DNA_START=122 /DNA_END=520 /DNA_ORIENTATION=-
MSSLVAMRLASTTADIGSEEDLRTVVPLAATPLTVGTPPTGIFDCLRCTKLSSWSLLFGERLVATPVRMRMILGTKMSNSTAMLHTKTTAAKMKLWDEGLLWVRKKSGMPNNRAWNMDTTATPIYLDSENSL